MPAQFGKVKILLGLLAIVLTSITHAFSQQLPLVVESANKNGDAVGDALTAVRAEAARVEKPIILIARLGENEVRRDLNRVRLRRICYGINLDFGRGCKNFVTAEGERVNGQGSVEIYVDGKLMAIIRAEHNRYLCVSCCNGCITVPAWDRASQKYRSKKR